METAAWLPTELDKEATALIGELEKEFESAPDVDAEEPTTQPADSGTELRANPDDALPGKAATAIEQAKERAGDKSEPLSDAVKRELGLYQREQNLLALENELKALRLENESYRKRELPIDAVEGIRTDTSRTLEALGLNPDQVVRQILAERLGDKAPPELREQVIRGKKETETERKLRALEEKIAFQEQALQARTFYEKVQDGARKFVTGEGIHEYAPTVAKVAKRNSERVFAEIMEEIQANARENAVRDPSAPLITYEEAAKRVEKRWSELSGFFTPEVPSNAQPETTKTQAQAPKSSTTTGSIKPPDRPLAPWLQKSTDVESEGLRAAIAEFRRIETSTR